jgi:hypothetical protein
MPIHDWSRVEACLFHDFHHAWIEEIKRVLNARVLPEDYYAMAEQHAAGFGPDVLTLQGQQSINASDEDKPLPNGWTPPRRGSGEQTVGLVEPRIQVTGKTEMEFYRRKQSSVTVRHVSGDRVVAMIEVVSPGNKNSRTGIESFVRKVAELLDQRIHLLILDLLPPGSRDPHGLHARIWEFIEGIELARPDRPLTLAAYESDQTVRAFVVPVAVGDRLSDMPLFLIPRACVEVPLEETYQAAVSVFPRRWRHLLERPASE